MYELKLRGTAKSSMDQSKRICRKDRFEWLISVYQIGCPAIKHSKSSDYGHVLGP